MSQKVVFSEHWNCIQAKRSASYCSLYVYTLITGAAVGGNCACFSEVFATVLY